MPRHRRKFLWTFVFAATFIAGERFSLAANRTPTDNELKKSEKILTRLAELDDSAHERTTFRSAARKHFPDVYIKASSLPEGDLKTELSTAAFFFDNAYSRAADSSLAECTREGRDLYRNICLKTSGVTKAQLALLKARLHLNWARTLLLYLHGDREPATIETIAEIKRERSIDLELSQRIVGILRSLERATNSYSSLGEFEAHNRVAKVSFDELSHEFDVVAATGSSLLAALPRTSLTYRLQNAINAYGDGLFWWQKTYRRTEKVVSVTNWSEPPSRNPLGFDAGAIDYAVIAFWRKAASNIAAAEGEIERRMQDTNGPVLVAGQI